MVLGNRDFVTAELERILTIRRPRNFDREGGLRGRAGRAGKDGVVSGKLGRVVADLFRGHFDTLRDI